MKYPFNRIFYSTDENIGGEVAETTDTTPEVITDASENTQTTTGSSDEENHPGAEADKADKEAASTQGTETAPEAQPAFVANYKVKAYGKDYEIPEKFRNLMTDKSSEEEMQKMFSKVFAFDEYQPKQEAIRKKMEQYEQQILPQYAKQDSIINEALHYAKQKDFDSYFELLGISQNDVLRWVDQKLSFTPEQTALYNQNRELQRAMYQSNLETSQLRGEADQSKGEAQRRQADMYVQELDYTLTKSEYAQKASEYNAKNGADSLRNLVIKHGNYASQVEGRNLSFDDAIKEVLERVSPTIATQAIQAKAAPPKEKPVLPVVQSKPTSATVKQPLSIKQIREKAEKMSLHADE